MNSPMALGGLRVVDHTDMRGALCGRVLGDLGAEVIRVPPVPDPDDLAHAHRNANKVAGDAAELESLIAEADLLIDNTGVDLDGLTERHPALVVVALTDMGLTGPRSGWKLEPLPAFASSGGHFLSGFRDKSPCWHPGYLAHDCASVFGAIGGLAAVMDRRRHGHGQVVEVSVQEAALVRAQSVVGAHSRLRACTFPSCPTRGVATPTGTTGSSRPETAGCAP